VTLQRKSQSYCHKKNDTKKAKYENLTGQFLLADYYEKVK
jgi:hypothetical protein